MFCLLLFYFYSLSVEHWNIRKRNCILLQSGCFHCVRGKERQKWNSFSLFDYRNVSLLWKRDCVCCWFWTSLFEPFSLSHSALYRLSPHPLSHFSYLQHHIYFNFKCGFDIMFVFMVITWFEWGGVIVLLLNHQRESLFRHWVSGHFVCILLLSSPLSVQRWFLFFQSCLLN